VFTPARVIATLAIVMASAAPALADGPTRRDDAYHAAQFLGGQHDANYAEWWYFNLVDETEDLHCAFTYTVIDPANRSGFGLSSVTAIVYTGAGDFTETAAYPTTSFLASSEQADVIIAGGSPLTWNTVRVLGDDLYHVAGAIHQQHDVSWNLLYVRRSEAWLGLDNGAVGVFPWERMSWLQYMPAAIVTGEVTIDGRRFQVANAAGYHDHNWGEWVPFTVTWNWTQITGSFYTFSLGDFPNSTTGAVTLEMFGERTVFTKDQYRLLHGQWSFDAVNNLWVPATTLVIAQNENRLLVVSIRASGIVPVRPPPELPLPLVPVIYEQSAAYSGVLFELGAAGEWRPALTFEGPGFNEYTGISTVRQIP
jgi:hypothetical protein